MITYGVDWSVARHVWVSDGSDLSRARRFEDMDAFLDWLSEPSRIVTEQSLESIFRRKRDAIIRRCTDEGHDLRFISSRMTWKAGKPKTDADDACAIWELVTLGCHTSKAYLSEDIDQDWAKRVKDVNFVAQIARAGGNAELGVPFSRTDLVLEVEQTLGKPKYLECFESNDRLIDPRRYLCDKAGRNYLKSMAEVLLATRAAANRREFERFLGLYQNGWACMLRAEVHKMGWAVIRNRDPEALKSDWRLCLRRSYHLLGQGTILPETGIV